VFWRVCAAQFNLKSECAVFEAKTRCNISAICSYIFIYGGQTSAETVMTVTHSRWHLETSPKQSKKSWERVKDSRWHRRLL